MNYTTRRDIALALALAVGLSTLVAACGQKGPLFLPEEEKQEQKKEQSS